MKKIGKQLKEQNIMKKTLYIAAAVIAVMFAASCQKDDVQAAKKGMTLSANVEETKAIIEKDGSVWHFNWEAGDIVKVTSPSEKTYSFIYDGTSFKCETAEPEAGTWSVAYAANSTDDIRYFVSQDGTLESAMAKYQLTGSCPSDGSSTLSCKMKPKFAVLAVTLSEVTNNIMIMGDAGMLGFLSGLHSDGTIWWSTQASFPQKKSIGTVTQYFVVPAEVSLTVTNHNAKKASTPKTLTAGKVYTLSI